MPEESTDRIVTRITEAVRHLAREVKGMSDKLDRSEQQERVIIERIAVLETRAKLMEKLVYGVVTLLAVQILAIVGSLITWKLTSG